jgi:DNA (cytosine-5)-methyltransferase 1
MFPQAVRAVREIRPLGFMFENVRGLLRESFSKYFGYIIHQLRYPTVTPKGDEEWTHHLARLERIHTAGEQTDLNYNVVFQCVNAVDYGVPQQRWRVFVVGVRSGLGIEYAYPQVTHEQDALLHDMWVSGEYWDRHAIPKHVAKQ